ncbi:hypothetical protein SAMN05216233_102279 [Desulfoluna spongiiphila]|uniref:PcRGLX/YetA-like central beta-sandwich domain-containing protein n=1 Tax=Desulfoluna spongiiphila TaxID=419481 RepID=A0A1G5BZ69_9BACT|nr:hypothetical protein SAMN05216233_102279 [Desulfoluna spongiiphila]
MYMTIHGVGSGLRKSSLWLFLLTFCFCCGVTVHGYPAIGHPVEIRIHELLPDGVKGLHRNHEVASFGIPLSEAAGVQSIDELGLVGGGAYQFRVLHRYPSGHVQWVLVDTLASVSAGEESIVWLTNGAGNSSGPQLASDLGEKISVDTGAARFVITKKNYNVFDSVFVGETSFLEPTGGVTAVSESTRYSSANDGDSTAVIEENGPVKAVIRCDGHLKSSLDDWLFGYTMRMYFYKGTGRTRLDLIIKNAEISSFTVKEFESLRIELPTTIANPSYLFSTGPGTISTGPVDGTAYLYQGYSSHKYVQYMGESGLLRERLVPDVGLKVVNGATVIHELGNEADHSEGFASYFSGAKRINCGIRNLYGMWPAGFTMDDEGHLYIDIYSTHNTKDDIHFAFYAHDKRQVVLEFTTEAKASQRTFYAVQYPLTGRTKFQHYKDTRAIYSHDRLATHGETRKFLKEIGLESFEISNVDTMRRYYVWGMGGGPNQYDMNLCQYLHYLQTGNGGAFLAAQNMDHHKMFGSTRHSDDFDFYRYGPERFKNINNIDPDKQPLAFNNRFLDREHSHDVSVPIGYLLAGDESIMNAWKDHGEYTLYDQGSGNHGEVSYYDGTTYFGYVRIFSRSFRRAGAFGQYTEDPLWHEKAGRMARTLLSLRDDPEDVNKDGWQLDRGYVYMHRHGNETYGGKRTNTVFMTYGIFADSLCYYDSVGFGNPLYHEDYYDYMLGLSYHALNELVPLGRQPYTYTLDKSAILDDAGAYPLSGLMAHGYEMTGNDQFLSRYKPHYNGMLTVQSKERVYSLYSSRFIHDYYNRNVCTGYVSPLGNGRVDMGNSVGMNISRSGSVYALTWEVPRKGIKRYQIKFSPQPMVENLGFDQRKRTYTYDPAFYDNFWAALNVGNEPTPKQVEGETESVAIDVRQVIHDYNARYGLEAGEAAYLSYDSTRDYFFAVKYYTVIPFFHGITIPSLSCPP